MQEVSLCPVCVAQFVTVRGGSIATYCSLGCRKIARSRRKEKNPGRKEKKALRTKPYDPDKGQANNKKHQHKLAVAHLLASMMKLEMALEMERVDGTG